MAISDKDFEVKRKFMILQINKVCRAPWSDKEMKKGKVIPVTWQSKNVALSVVPLYEEKGWLITREVMLDKTGRSLLLIVKKPKNPEQF